MFIYCLHSLSWLIVILLNLYEIIFCKRFTLLIYSLIVILLNFYEIIFRKLFTLLIYSTLSLSSTPSCNSLSNFSRLFQRKEFTIQNEIWGQYPILTSSYFGPILFHRDPNLTRSLFWCWTLIPLWPEMGPGNFATHCCRQICCVSHVVQPMKLKQTLRNVCLKQQN